MLKEGRDNHVKSII